VIARDIPTGLVDVQGREPIGVHLNAAISGERGAPDFKGRWWFMTQATHRGEFTSGGGRSWSRLKRGPHPAFSTWNKEAFKLGAKLPAAGPGRLGIVRGNLVHARWDDAARWNRRAQKLPEGHANPRSRKPSCEGNGVWALRYSGEQNGEEIFDRIACPNQDCPFAMSGLCRPAGHLIFRLRWNPEDEWERQFSPLIAEWTTTSWESIANLKGLLEHVLGTEALLTAEERKTATAEEREAWRAGLAAEVGVVAPSLVGLPFTMTLAERTRPAKRGSATGERYTVVAFSPDGDLLDGWLLTQARRRRELAGMTAPVALLPAVTDPPFLETERHDSVLELTGAPLSPEPGEVGGDPGVPVAHAEPGALLAPDTPALIGPAKAADIERRALLACGSLDGIRAKAADLCGTGKIADVPADLDPALEAFIREASRSRRA
jgi:hypothetical protein